MKGICMEPSKSLIFKYNAFTPAFRRRTFLLATLLTPMFWILISHSESNLYFIFSGTLTVISYIADYIDSTLGTLMSLLVAYILKIYIMILLPPQLLLLFFNLYDKSAKADFYENHVVLSYGNKEVRLDQDKVAINLIIKNQGSLSCIIYTPDTDIAFLSSKIENKKLIIDYEESSLYCAMKEVKEFLCPTIEESECASDGAGS